MTNDDIFKTATLPLANFATAGAIGTAATTVDIASSFVITQTTAGIALTIPNPTNANAGDRLLIGSSSTSTATVSVAGVTLIPGEFSQWLWSGAAWLFADGGRNAGASISVATIPAGNLLVTHNLNMPTGTFSQVIYQCHNAIGNQVVLRRNKANDTANAMAFNVIAPITANTPLVFDFTPLA
jgi:hypothetical protein